MVDTELKKCPKCGAAAAALIDIDKGKRLILAESKLADLGALPDQVCGTCYADVTALVSKGARLRLEQQAREKNKHLMWKSRVNLVKQARALMQQKAYSEAAVTYEKYLRVLEISYDLKPGLLNPDVFGKSSRSKELSVIATTYWDLMRIYDTNPNYRERMLKASQKLAQFLPFSPIFPDVTAKAQQFVSSSKNPDVVRGFLKLVKANTKRCFVATAAFESEDHPEVEILRQWRDQSLEKSSLGRQMVQFYYQVSPPVARYLDQSPRARSLTRKILSHIAHSVDKKLEIKTPSGRS
jgi:hypothetical protein